jgi:hypothetical protein
MIIPHSKSDDVRIKCRLALSRGFSFFEQVHVRFCQRSWWTGSRPGYHRQEGEAGPVRDELGRGCMGHFAAYGQSFFSKISATVLVRLVEDRASSVQVLSNKQRYIIMVMNGWQKQDLINNLSRKSNVVRSSMPVERKGSKRRP